MLRPPRRTIRTWIELVPLSEIHRHWPVLSCRCFTAEEQHELSTRPAATAAGFLALKRALSRWAHRRDKPVGTDESHFVLTHHRTGAPRLVSLPSGMKQAPGELSLSIAHSRRYACGMVTQMDDPDE